MKITIIIANLLILVSCSSQPETPLIPEEGSISFKRDIKIIDQKLVDSTYSRSLNKVLEHSRNSSVGIIKEIAVSRRSKNLGMQKIIDMQNMSKDAFKKTCHPNFMDKDLVNTFSFELGLILYAHTAKGSKSESCVIDPVNETITPLIRDKKNKVIKCMPTKYNYRNTHDFCITEYRNDTKVIHGYNCFKILLEINNPVPIAKELPRVKEKYIMYVTEEIIFKYHPIIRYKEVLEKYYPLEVIETSDLIEGYEKIYTLTEMTLK
ncbi:hypothetical protein [Aquimarina algiphila]|uniref:hypothetical protein n=1 Tax=Aquimarina algiphila TaxID=2047982 RepID=UPI00232EDDAC|nr:hypothetical protein [Aquimarina algiphila]